MHKGLIIPSNNTKFKILSDESINYVLFCIINDFLDNLPPDENSIYIRELKISDIKNKIDLFEMNYLI